MPNFKPGDRVRIVSKTIDGGGFISRIGEIGFLVNSRYALRLPKDRTSDCLKFWAIDLVTTEDRTQFWHEDDLRLIDANGNDLVEVLTPQLSLF